MSGLGLGLGFWENYIFDYALSGSKLGADFTTTQGRVLYIIWCYFHVGLVNWIRWLVPPCFYEHGNDNSYWSYWILHLIITICLIKLVIKVTKFIASGKLMKLFKQSYEFDTGKIVGGINFCKWYRGECTNEKFYKSPSSRIVKDYLKSVSDICIELWLDSKKKSYATIIYINDTYAMSLHGDDGKEVFSTKCKAGETVTFGSKEKKDSNVTKLFNRLSFRLNFLNKKYEQNRVAVKK